MKSINKMTAADIRNDREYKYAEFAIYCIEEYSSYKNLNPKDTYKKLKYETDILDKLIIGGYNILHTQGKDYILHSIDEALKNRRIH
ncbi:MAG: DUF3791 domain-containing protein [Bacilli bacterium]